MVKGQHVNVNKLASNSLNMVELSLPVQQLIENIGFCGVSLQSSEKAIILFNFKAAMLEE